MTNAKNIAKTMLKEFAQKYGAGWHLITADVKAALMFDRAVLDAITFGRSKDGTIDAEFLAEIRMEIRRSVDA